MNLHVPAAAKKIIPALLMVGCLTNLLPVAAAVAAPTTLVIDRIQPPDGGGTVASISIYVPSHTPGWTYTLVVNGTPQASPMTVSDSATGWMRSANTRFSWAALGNGDVALGVRASDGGNTADSCTLLWAYRVADYAECGSVNATRILTPIGVAAIARASRVDVYAPNLTGAYYYQAQIRPIGGEWRPVYGLTAGTGGATLQFPYAGNGVAAGQSYVLEIRQRELLTLRASEWSCGARFDALDGVGSRCGTVTAPVASAPTGSYVGVTSPPASIDNETTRTVLSLFITALAAIAGAWIGEARGALFGAFAGLVFSVAFGWAQFWFLAVALLALLVYGLVAFRGTKEAI